MHVKKNEVLTFVLKVEDDRTTLPGDLLKTMGEVPFRFRGVRALVSSRTNMADELSEAQDLLNEALELLSGSPRASVVEDFLNRVRE